MKRTLSFLTGALFLYAATGQVTVTLQCSKDAALGYHDGANTSGNNYGSAQQNAAFVIPAYSNPGTNGNRAVMDFPLNTLPQGAVVLSASLNLHATGPLGVLSGHVGTANTSLVQRVTQSWQEFGVTWNNQPSATSVNQFTLQQSSGSAQDYLNVDATALVQDALANPSSSFGFLLKLAVEAPSNGLLFKSRENPDPAERPTLVVTYVICGQAAAGAVHPAVNCSGSSFTLAASATGGDPVWFNSQSPSVPVATGTSVVLTAATVSASTVHTFEVGNSACPQLPRSAVQVTVHPSPVLAVSAPATVCAGQQATLSVSGASSYTWMHSDGMIGNHATLHAVLNSSASFTVTGTNAYGCSDMAVVPVNAVSCEPVRVEEHGSLALLDVFPNPSAGEVFVTNRSAKELKVDIFDGVGARVAFLGLRPAEVIELRGLRAGAYFIRIQDHPGQALSKLIIIR